MLCFFSEELDLLLAVPWFVILCTFVEVLLTILEHAIDQPGEPMSHSGDGFSVLLTLWFEGEYP